jgi:hypothetical protein
MHEVVVVQYHRGWRTALFYFLDLSAFMLILFALWAIFFTYYAPSSHRPTQVDTITLPNSGQTVPVLRI